MGITISKNDNNIDITTNTENLIIANNVSGNTITVDKEQTSIITVSTPGPKGDPYLYNANDDLYVGNITGSNISASGYVSASQFIGNLTGNAATATSATTATTATNALNLYVGNDDTGDTSNSILFTNSGGAGNRSVYEDTNLSYDNTNNHLYVGGNVFSANYFTLGMSGVLTPSSTHYVGPSLEGKFGVQWSTRYAETAAVPNPVSSNSTTVPSALAGAGMTIPFKSRLKSANAVIGGTVSKDVLILILIYYPPRTSSPPEAGATETGYYLGNFYFNYETSDVDPTYGIAGPSLAEVVGEQGGTDLELNRGGFIVPIGYSSTSNPFYIDAQIQLERIGE